MILYQALSAYQILECMVHRQIYYRDKKCILLLGTYIKERMPRYFELETKGFFDEVYLFRFGGYRGTEKEILEQVEEELRKSIPYKAENFEKILIAGIHTYLQVYLLSRGISFEMFEDGSGALSRPEILADIHRKSAPARYNLIEKYGLYDHTSPLITKKYCDMKSQKEGFSDPKAEDFQVMEGFKMLPRKRQGDILHIFEIPELDGKESDVLLLTQQFANLGQMSFDGQVSIYRHLFDYYLSDRKVLIKHHPDDILYYSFLFPDAEIIEGTFPSEFLPLAFENMPGTVCTVSSTGVNQIRHAFKEQLFFNKEYEESFQYDSLYYMALCFAAYLKAEGILVEGMNRLQLSNMARCMGSPWDMLPVKNLEEMKTEDEPCGPGWLLICGDTSVCRHAELYLEEGKVRNVLYLNEKEKYVMYDYGKRERFFQMVPLAVREGNEEHTMYFYTGIKEVKEMAGQFRTKKHLTYENIDISIENMTEEEIKIHMLEGILAATERRLLEYIRSEKELKEELRKLKEGR